MLIEQLDESLIGTGHIVKGLRRPSTKDPYWIGYHGTSSCYAERIEKEGIDGTKKAIANCDLKFVLDVANDIKKQFPELGKDRAFEGELAQLENSINSTVVNFFPLSELALYHTRSRGGQTVQNALLPLMTNILKRIESACDPREMRLRNILNNLRLSERGYPVVYAVYLKNVRRLGYQVPEMAIQTNVVVRPSHFIAKVEAPDFNLHAQIGTREAQLREEANHLALSQTSKHFIGIMYRDELEPVSAEFLKAVSKRAYELWEAGGSVHGNDWAHWFQAEDGICERELASTIGDFRVLPNSGH